MAYHPHEWSNNEAIPAARLNTIEQGVADAHETADKAEKAAADAANIGVANGEDIAKLFDEIDQLREALNTLTS